MDGIMARLPKFFSSSPSSSPAKSRKSPRNGGGSSTLLPTARARSCHDLLANTMEKLMKQEERSSNLGAQFAGRHGISKFSSLGGQIREMKVEEIESEEDETTSDMDRLWAQTSAKAVFLPTTRTPLSRRFSGDAPSTTGSPIARHKPDKQLTPTDSVAPSADNHISKPPSSKLQLRASVAPIGYSKGSGKVLQTTPYLLFLHPCNLTST